jgi:hypothetical protein
MNTELIEELLNEDESPSLDFKQMQYPFVRADDNQKSELLKDILAFANAWRRADAYILIGVEEVKGRRSKVVGIANHLDEASLQQFVNGKTNRPIDFSYHAFPFEGRQLGIIRIPVQERPFFLTEKYGRLAANTVYIRRGSSTDCADPDEVARMGAKATVSRQVPVIELEFADVGEHARLGNSPTLELEILSLPDISQIPIAGRGTIVTSITEMVNPDYYREFARYLLITRFLRPVGFALKNVGASVALNAKVEVIIPKKENLVVLDLSDYPDPPQYSGIPVGPVGNLRRALIDKNITTVSEREAGWEISAKIGSIQPKADAWSEEFYVGSMTPCSIDLEALIYADNLPDPLTVPLTLSITAHKRDITVEEIRSEADNHRSR